MNARTSPKMNASKFRAPGSISPQAQKSSRPGSAARLVLAISEDLPNWPRTLRTVSRSVLVLRRLSFGYAYRSK
jgi:hypothetical protein